MPLSRAAAGLAELGRLLEHYRRALNTSAEDSRAALAATLSWLDTLRRGHNERISALDFVTDPDETLDVTAELRAAAAYVETFGGHLWFPPRTYIVSPQADTYCVVVADDTHFEGPATARIKMADSVGNYKALIGPKDSSNDRFTIRGLTLDLNQDNSVDLPAVNTEGNQRWGIYIIGDDFVMEDTIVEDHDGINTVYVTGARPTVRNAKFLEIGGATDHDTSTVYFGTSGGTCVGCTFVGDGAGGTGLSARSAIEVHGPHNTVAGNKISAYQYMVQLVGTATPADSWGNSVVNNEGDTLASGIELWSFAAAPLTGADISGNHIRIDRDSWFGTLDNEAYFGIGCDQAATADFTDIDIHHNDIVFNSFTDAGNANDIDDSGLQFRKNTGTFDLVRCNLTDNTIVGSVGTGILVRVDTHQCSVNGNRVVNPAQSGYVSLNALYKSGMVIDGAHTDLEIDRNWFVDTQGTATLRDSGIYMDAIGTVTRGRLGINYLHLVDTSINPTLYKSDTDRDKFHMRVKETLFSGSDTSTNTSYEDIDGAGSVTVFCTEQVRVTVGAQMSNSSTAYTYVSVDISSPTSTAANNGNAAFFYSPAANIAGKVEKTSVLTVVPGSNTFKPQVAVSAGTGTVGPVWLQVEVL